MFEVLDEVCIPYRATKYSAYVDLFSRENVVINPGERAVVKLGIKIDQDFFIYQIGKIDVDAGGEVTAPDNCGQIIHDFLSSNYLEIAIRSSLAVKGLIIANGSGKVDLDYPDEIGIILFNPIEDVQDGGVYGVGEAGYGEYVIKKGDKVAQCTLVPHNGRLMGYESTTVRIGGFGSTDKGDKR